MERNNWLAQRNHTPMVDLYELTMGQAYFSTGMKDTVAYFEMFYRTVPEKGGYALSVGLEEAIEYIKNLHFSPEYIDYLRSTKLFTEDFLNYIKDFKFVGDIWALPEGTPVYPKTPIMIVRAPIIQAQYVETALLAIMNSQSAVATKASRICYFSKVPVSEFGARRAFGPEGAIFASRAGIIGGCSSTSNTYVGLSHGLPTSGTMAHSFVQAFPSELEAFRAYANVYPDSCTLLIDTFDTLHHGIQNAITVFKELQDKGHSPSTFGVRIDSGDLAYLSKKVRQILDDAGFQEAKIFLSSALDEHVIQDIRMQGANFNALGVGENISRAIPLGGVYKLVAIEEDGNLVPKIKKSDNPEKTTYPGFKQLWRIYHKETGKSMADLLTLTDEVIDPSQPLTITHPIHTWKQTTYTNYTIKPMLQKIFENGELVYDLPSMNQIIDYTRKQLATLYEEERRLSNPHIHYVDLSDKLRNLFHQMLHEHSDIL